MPANSGPVADSGRLTRGDDGQVFRLELGQDALARDWPAVHAMLAPWLRATWTVERVRRFFEDEYRSTLAENDVEGIHYPEYPDPQLGGNNFMNAAALREPISFAAG